MQDDTQRIIDYFYSTVKIVRASDWYWFHYYFYDMEQKMYIMCLCALKYDHILIFFITYIKMSCIIVFLTNFESVISWYFLSQFYKSVKDLHKVQFIISINTNIWSYTITITELSKHQTADKYQRLYDCGEIDLKSDVNIPASSKLHQSTTVSSQCDQFS